MAGSKTFPFLRLPRELQDGIIEQFLLSQAKASVKVCLDCSHRPGQTHLLVGFSIENLAQSSPIIYDLITSAMKRVVPPLPTSLLVQAATTDFLHALPPARHSSAYLPFHAVTSIEFEDPRSEARHGWSCLLNNCPRLTHFKFDLHPPRSIHNAFLREQLAGLPYPHTPEEIFQAAVSGTFDWLVYEQVEFMMWNLMQYLFIYLRDNFTIDLDITTDLELTHSLSTLGTIVHLHLQLRIRPTEMRILRRQVGMVDVGEKAMFAPAGSLGELAGYLDSPWILQACLLEENLRRDQMGELPFADESVLPVWVMPETDAMSGFTRIFE